MTNGQTTKVAIFAWIALGTIWGSNFIFMKWAIDYITPLQVVLARVVLGFLPVLVYAVARRQLKVSHLKYFGHFAVMACLAAAIYYYGFARGTALLPSGVAGAVSGAIPLFSMLAAVVLMSEEKFDRSRVLGLLIGLFGVLTIARPFAAGSGSASVEGVVFMVIGSLSLGVSFVYARRFITPLNLPAAALTTYQLGVASLLLMLVTPAGGIAAVFADPTAAIGLVVGLGLLGTGIAYILYYFIIDRLGAVGASSVTYLPPVVALLIGAIIVGEPIAALDYLAAGMILAGVFLLNRRQTE